MISLILEGGGMRGAFTAGVLDEWLEQGLYFHSVYGVSAGACQACSYLARQKGRGLRLWLESLNDPRFCSLRSLVSTGDLFGADYNYRLLPLELDPVDEAAYLEGGAKLTVVVTDVNTGRPVYLPLKGMREPDMPLIRATASMPLVSNMVPYAGGLYLDGGVSDSIPVRRAIADGHEKSVLVLTQAPGYRKQPNRAMPLVRLKYHRYPQLVEAMARRHLVYNETLDFIDREAAAGRLFVLRPDVTPEVGRIEKDPRRLKHLYEIGRAVARREYGRLMAFIDNSEI